MTVRGYDRSTSPQPRGPAENSMDLTTRQVTRLPDGRASDARPAAVLPHHRTRVAVVAVAAILGVTSLVGLTACSATAPATDQSTSGTATSMAIGGQPSSSGPASSPTTQATVPATKAANAPCLSPEWVHALPPRARLAQLLMVQLATPPTAGSFAALAKDGLGGVIIGTGQEAASGPALLDLKTPDGLPLWVATDQEGGGVARLTKISPKLPWPRELARKTPVQIESDVATHAAQMKAAGITVDFAPVVDVAPASYENASIGQRSFSDNPATVTADASAFARGLQSANVMATLKHFPGHGSASADTHKGAASTPPLSSMQKDLQPYRDLLSGPSALPTDKTAVMVAHLDVPGLTDGGLPTSLNPKAYDLLRNQIGFQGVAFTDDLGGMKAVTERMSLPAAVTTAIIAGADVAIWVDKGQARAALDALEKAMADKSLPESRIDEAATRVLKAKQALGLRVC